MSTLKFRAMAVVVAAVVAAALSVAGVGSASGATTAGSPASKSTTKYYKASRVCKVAKKEHAQCFAMRRVAVPSGTPGARAMTADPGYVTGPAGGFTPADLAKAYAVNSATATTTTVAVVDAFDDPNALADLNVFDAQYGLPAETATSFRKVAQDGSTTFPTPDAGWAGEISLDLDAVRGLCHTCKIILVEAKSNSFADLGTAENRAVTLGAKVVTNSFGGAESGPVGSTLLAAFNHPGVAITVSTGDHGMFDWDLANGGGTSSNAPAVPSSFSTVVAVGGTSLYLNDDATRSGETVWNENGPSDLVGGSFGPMGATGGGCSTQINAPGWQTAVAGWSQTRCLTKRLAADVSALADPYTGYDIYDSYQSTGWQTFGGTSLASPLVAAMWALAGGPAGVTYPALSLYGHFKTAPTTLYDVVTGGNGLCNGTPAGSCAGSVGGPPNSLGSGTLDCAWLPAPSSTLSAGRRACDAATGYDGPSGVGTPKGTVPFKAMTPTAVVTKPSTVTHGVSASFSGASSTDPFPGGSISTYTWTWGDGTANSTGVSPTHTYAAAGSFPLKLTVTDNYGRTGTVTVTLVVG